MRELTAMVKGILEKEYKSSEDQKKVEEKVKKLLENEKFLEKPIAK